MKVVMLSGKAGSGKDTAYRLLKELYPHLVIGRFAFADKLKSIARDLTWNGIKDISGRRLLQNIGNIAREYNKNVWADVVVVNMEVWEENLDVAVITDFRFENEYEVIKNRFDDVITVNIVGRQSYLGSNKDDISEHSLDNFKFDYTICNDSTIDNFKNQLKVVL